MSIKDLMQYQKYYGSVHFDSEELIFHGKIEFIRALVTYEATDATSSNCSTATSCQHQ